jgi:ribosomal protein S27E
VRKMHRLYFYCKLRPHSVRKMQSVFLLRIETTDCEENVQIVFSLQIETTDCMYCGDNEQIVFLLQIATTDCEKNAQTVF